MTSGNNKMFRLAAGMAVAALFSFLTGCGPSSSSSGSDTGGAGPTPTPTPAVANGSLKMMISDASTEDWATIGVKVLSISLVPQGGGAPALAYTAPSPAPTTNLVQLDQLAELLGNPAVPANTYTSATLEISANPQDILLTASASPEAGFAGTAGATVPSSQIRVQNATGSAGSLTTSVSVSFSAPLVVTANQSNALDIEFDLSHPAFLVDHVPAGGGAAFWAVNFKPCLRHHPIGDLRAFVLREPYGTVTAVASSNTSFTMTKDFAVYPPTSPETAIASTESLEILADSTNGTIFYDLDAKTRTVIHDFSAQAATLDGKYVRVAARYQSDGSLVAVRVWASATFNEVWLSPEGHVLQVNAAAGQLVIQNEEGTPVPVTVNATTEFFFRTPASAVADATPIGTGTAFLANLVRGFKVHASPVDPERDPSGGADGGYRGCPIRRHHFGRHHNRLHLHAEFRHRQQRLHSGSGLHLQQLAKWHRLQRERDHRVQMVVLYVPHTGGVGSERNPRLRHGHQRLGELRRLRRRNESVGRDLRHVERSSEPEWLGGAVDDPRTDASAFGECGHSMGLGLERRLLWHDRAEWRQHGFRGCQHGVRIRSVGLPGGPDQRHHHS